MGPSFSPLLPSRIVFRSPTSVQSICKRCQSTLTRSSTAIHRKPRLRFAPSPTGYLHLGGLRTALANYLTARRWGGDFILRIEDTDQARVVPGAEDAMRETLEWAGLEYDEGVGVGGSHGPYKQSQRLDLYRQHVRTLLDHDHAYECFCTPSELEVIKNEFHARGIKQSYDGRCRHLTDEDRSRRKKAGHKYVVRIKDEARLPDLPDDIVFGEVKTHSDWAGAQNDDFVLIKSDGYPTYHLANVVDDHAMEISHVLRGEEWLSSLPKHINLYRAFGWEPPKYGHLPLMVNEDGSKLSKRNGSVKVDDYRQKGYEPEALINFLALLGWDAHSTLESLASPDSPPTASDPSAQILPPHTRSDHNSLYEVFTPAQLVGAFDIHHITKRKAAVNAGKLDFLNKMHLRRKAGRLGKDGVLVALGKEGLGVGGWGGEKRDGEDLDNAAVLEMGMQERKVLLDRVQAIFKSTDVIKSSKLVDDRNYIEAVFDVELPRIVMLNDLRTSSIFFFLDPEYEHSESINFLKSLNLSDYLRHINTMIPILEERMRHLGEREGKEMAVNEDVGWDSAHDVVGANNLSRRSEVLSPMRHALTGRMKGPSVPAIMSVLGPDRTLARLRAGCEFVQSLIDTGRDLNAPTRRKK